jgi:glucose-1-phosphate adenylyltransferase
MPFGGKFRLIDFALSNCANSQINRALVLTQYKSYSLIKHIRHGWIQRQSRQNGSICIVPAQQWIDEQTWYRGSADAVFQTLDIIKSHHPKYVLIISGDHIYGLDYGEMLATHVETNADVTLLTSAVPRERASHYGVVQVDNEGQITGFEEMPADPQPLPEHDDMSLASMGVYVFNTDLLEDLLIEDAKNTESQHNIGRNIIPALLHRGGAAHAHLLRNPVKDHLPYWNDIFSIDDYYDANMALVSGNPPFDLYHPAWPIRTHQAQMPPARFTGHKSGGCHSENSMVSGGCKVFNSGLDRSILFSDVTVHDGCQLSGVLALPGCRIGAGSRLTNVILDNRTVIEPNTVIGENLDADRETYTVTPNGRVVVNNFQPGYYDDLRSGNIS